MSVASGSASYEDEDEDEDEPLALARFFTFTFTFKVTLRGGMDALDACTHGIDETPSSPERAVQYSTVQCSAVQYSTSHRKRLEQIASRRGAERQMDGWIDG